MPPAGNVDDGDEGLDLRMPKGALIMARSLGWGFDVSFGQWADKSYTLDAGFRIDGKPLVREVIGLIATLRAYANLRSPLPPEDERERLVVQAWSLSALPSRFARKYLHVRLSNEGRSALALWRLLPAEEKLYFPRPIPRSPAAGQLRLYVQRCIDLASTSRKKRQEALGPWLKLNAEKLS